MTSGDVDLPTRLFDGRLLLHQPPNGHRIGTDAVLLAAVAAPEPGDLLVDIGSGVGAVGLAVASRDERVRVRLVEREAPLADLARENVVLNRLDDRVVVDTMDIFADRNAVRSAAWVVSNPPFAAASRSRLSPDAMRARAHALDGQGTSHGDWLRAMLRFAAPNAAVVLIHRPDALPALLDAAERRIGGIHVMPIHARADAPAIRIMVGGTVGSRAPFVLTPPLVLHRSDGRFTDQAEALHRGEAVLSLLPKRKSRPKGPASPDGFI